MNIVDQIFAYAKKNGEVDNSCMAYNPQEYNFSLEEFYVLWNYIHDSFDQKNILSRPFYEALIYLEYKKELYVWRVMSGQGTACQIFSEKGWGDKIPKKNRAILDDNLFQILEPKYTELTIKEIIE